MKKFLKNPWTIGIGTTVIGGVALSVVLDLIKKISILSTLKDIITFIGNCLVAFLTFEIKVWWLMVAVAAVFAILWIIAKCSTMPRSLNQSSFLKYTQDSFLGHTWEWTWKKNWEGTYEVEGLYPICNKCRTPLLQTGNFYGQMKCPRCHDITHINPSEEAEILVLIYDNARKNNYKKQASH